MTKADNPMEADRAIADLLAALAGQYRRQIMDPEEPPGRTRLETIRKLELVIQSIKSLMRSEQAQWQPKVPPAS